MIWFWNRVWCFTALFGSSLDLFLQPGTQLNTESWLYLSFCCQWPYLFRSNNGVVVPGLVLVHPSSIYPLPTYLGTTMELLSCSRLYACQTIPNADSLQKTCPLWMVIKLACLVVTDTYVNISNVLGEQGDNEKCLLIFRINWKYVSRPLAHLTWGERKRFLV